MYSYGASENPKIHFQASEALFHDEGGGGVKKDGSTFIVCLSKLC